MANSNYQHDQVRDHSFDGIQEYDNKLPAWIMTFFYIGIAWSMWYYAHYHWGLFGDGAVGPKAWEREEAQAIARAAEADTGPLSDAELLLLASDPERIGLGQAVWTSAGCNNCHTTDAWGQVGPNLRDDFWVYGNQLSVMVETIEKGRSGGMPAHKGKLSRPAIQNVVFYIADLNRNTLKNDDGTTIEPSAKAPQGDYMTFDYLDDATSSDTPAASEEPQS